MKVTFDPRASNDLDRIFAWIVKDSPRAALDMIARIEEKVMRLESPELTNMGRPGFVDGTRELIEWPISSCTRWTNRGENSRRLSHAWRPRPGTGRVLAAHARTE
jgi:plasmid stabilization system protein ParE